MPKVLLVITLAIIVSFIGFILLNSNLSFQSEKSGVDQYTLSEVATHNSESDCWMAIDGKIYNATSYVSLHPGKEILNGCGKEASELFNARPSSGKGPHPQQAIIALEKLYIGELAK